MAKPKDPKRKPTSSGAPDRTPKRARAPAPTAPTAPPEHRPVLPPSESDLDRAYIEAAYLDAFPDIAEAVAAGTYASGLDHFLREGRADIAEGRRPLPPGFPAAPAAPGATPPADVLRFAAARPTFDEALYAALFPDVAANVHDGHIASGFDHWIQAGYREVMVGARALRFVPASLGGGARRPSLRLGALFHRPFGINLFAPLGMDSEAGQAARGLVRAIRAADLPLDLWPFEAGASILVPPVARAHGPRFRVNLLFAPPGQTVALLADYPPGTFDDAYTIAYWPTLLGSFPAELLPAFQDLDEIWTGSDFERAAIAAVAPVPVQVVPIPLPPEPTAPGAPADQALLDLPPGAFVMLTPFDPRTPGVVQNTEAVIRAFQQATTDADNTLLVVAIAGPDPAAEPGSDAPLATPPLAHAGSRVRVIGPLSAADSSALLARADCLVSAHRGTGPVLEIVRFMAQGKPVIATGHGGAAGLVAAETGYPVARDLAELPAPLPPYPAGHVWATPRQPALAAAIHAVLHDRPAAIARGATAARRVIDRFAPSTIGHAIARRLAALQLDIETPAFLDRLQHDPPAAPRRPMPAIELHPGPLPKATFTFIVAVAPHHDATVLDTLLAAVQAQTHRAWEMLLVPRPGLAPPVQAWLDDHRGFAGRLRVLPPAAANDGVVEDGAVLEAATCSFIVAFAAAAALPADTLERVAAILAEEPAVDIVHRPASPHGSSVFAVRKRLLLGAGLLDVDPDAILSGPGQSKILGASRLIRLLPPG